MAQDRSFRTGDHVTWDISQGGTSGTVDGRETGTTKAGGQTAKASKAEPQYRVKSNKSGKEAVHRPEELNEG